MPASLALSTALVVGLAGATTAQATEPAATTTSVSTATTATTATATMATVAAVSAPLTAAQRAAIVVAKKRAKAVRVARAQVGDRYRAGRSGPNAFDCSGLALYVTKKVTGRSLPHYSKAQYRATKRVSRSQLRPGDLVFFFRHGAHHVGVYIGGGKMVSAANPRQGVRVDSVFTGWYGKRYSGAGRVI